MQAAYQFCDMQYTNAETYAESLFLKMGSLSHIRMKDTWIPLH